MLESGARCVTAVGTIGMLLSSVCNWDFKEQVHHTKTVLSGFIVPNHSDATALRGSYFGDGDGPYHLSNVGCSGEERTLLECSHSNIGYHTCTPGRDAGVRCDGNDNNYCGFRFHY